jgi:hypothetical protein
MRVAEKLYWKGLNFFTVSTNLATKTSIVRMIKAIKIRWADMYLVWREERRVQVLVGKPDGNRPLERLRQRWDDNLRMDLQEAGRGVMDWIELVQNRDRWRALVNAVMNFRVV